MKNSLIVKIIFFTSIIYFSYQYIDIRKPDLTVSFLNAGQGDAVLIQTPFQQNIIIDLANTQAYTELEKKIAWWDKEIDLLIITHPHNDHIEGIKQLIKKYKIKRLVYTAVVHDSSIYNEIIKKLKDVSEIYKTEGVHKLVLGNNCELYFLYPLIDISDTSPSNLNNSSIVNKLDCNNSIFFFTGDIEKEVEDKLLANNINIKSDVIKIPHHGSNSSSQEEFLKKVEAKIAIISVGKNSFGHPSYTVLNRIKNIGSEIYRTDILGTITIVSDAKYLIKK